MSAGRLLREVRALLAHRQPVLGYLVALSLATTSLDLAVAATRHRVSSFSAFARNEFDGVVVWRAIGALDDSSIVVWVAVVAAIAGSSLLWGWLRSCYLIALVHGTYSLRSPRRILIRFTAYALLFELVGLGITGIVDTGNGGIGLLLLLATTPPTLYADYAIVLDDVGVVEGISRSLRAFWQTLPVSLLATVLLLFLLDIAGLTFKSGFTDSTHVQPSYLVAWLLLADVLLQFVFDVILVTLYRATGVSEAGRASPQAADPPPGASD